MLYQRKSHVGSNIYAIMVCNIMGGHSDIKFLCTFFINTVGYNSMIKNKLKETAIFWMRENKRFRFEMRAIQHQEETMNVVCKYEYDHENDDKNIFDEVISFLFLKLFHLNQIQNIS